MVSKISLEIEAKLTINHQLKVGILIIMFMPRVERRLIHLIGMGLNYIHYRLIADSSAQNTEMLLFK